MYIVSFQCLVAFSETESFQTSEWRTRSSVLLTVFSSFLFSLYVIFLMNNADHEEILDIPLLCGMTFRRVIHRTRWPCLTLFWFTGFTGLFCLTTLWPGFFLLHFIKWELFEWPNMYQWIYLLVNSLLGTVLSQVLWLW